MISNDLTRFLLQSILLTLPFSLFISCSTALKNGDTFTYEGLKRGSIMTKDHCKDSDSRIWINVNGKGECIRYFSAGLKNENKIVHVWFHGDRLRTVGRIRDSNIKVRGYHDNSPYALQQIVNAEFQHSKIPFIRFSKPGTYGSSGDHKKRRSSREVEVINAALNKLKEKYRIRLFILSGQSGGGHTVGSLLSLRNDITCAVITSGVVSVGMRNRIKNWRSDITGYSRFYDPVKYVDKIAQNYNRPIFIVGDPKDSQVPFSTQVHYYNELNKYGHNAWLIKSSSINHHSLAWVGFDVVRMWFDGTSPVEIVSKLTVY